LLKKLHSNSKNETTPLEEEVLFLERNRNKKSIVNTIHPNIPNLYFINQYLTVLFFEFIIREISVYCPIKLAEQQVQKATPYDQINSIDQENRGKLPKARTQSNPLNFKGFTNDKWIKLIPTRQPNPLLIWTQ
jgi:hypothetical protein